MLKLALQDSIIYGLAAVLSRGLPILMLPMYTKIISPADFGVFDLIISLGILVNLTVSLEIGQGVSRFWVDASDKVEQKSIASTGLWFAILSYTIFMVIGLVHSVTLNNLILGKSEYLDVFRLGIIYIVLNGVYLILLNQFRWELRSKEYALISFIYAIVSLALILIYCFWLEWGLLGIMLAQISSVTFASVYSLWCLRKTFGFQFNRSQLKSMLKFSVPLVPASIAIFTSLYLNRFAINHYGSLADVGYFAISNRISGLIMVLLIGIQTGLPPLIYQYYHNTQTPEKIARLFRIFMGLGIFGCLFLGLFSNELSIIFLSSNFILESILIGIMSFTILLSQMHIFAPGLSIAKKSHWQLWLSLSAASISIIANWLLVPVWGIWGAVIATLLSSTVFFVLWVNLSQNLYKIPYEFNLVVINILVFIVFIFLGNIVSNLNINILFIIFIKLFILFTQLLIIYHSRLIRNVDICSLTVLMKNY